MNANSMRCYRPNGTCYAILTPSEWTTLRNAGKLDAELKRRRDSGVVLEVKTLTGTITPRHLSPRVEAEEAARIRAEAEAAERSAALDVERPDATEDLTPDTALSFRDVINAEMVSGDRRDARIMREYTAWVRGAPFARRALAFIGLDDDGGAE